MLKPWGGVKIPTNPLGFLRLLVPPAPLEELTEALQGHDDSVVSPLLTAAETIIASRSNSLIFKDGVQWVPRNPNEATSFFMLLHGVSHVFSH